MSGRPGVILDRDGTLVDVVRDEETGVVVTAFHPDHLRFLPGVVDGLRLLSRSGFVLAVATNQPGPAKGQCSRSAVARTHEALVARLAEEGIAVAEVAVCLHHPHGGPGGDASLIGPCDCRKPKPGLVTGLVASLGLDPARTFVVGDTSSDVEAGRAAGVRTALVVPAPRCELCPLAKQGPPRADVVGTTLLEVAAAVAGAVGPEVTLR